MIASKLIQLPNNAWVRVDTVTAVIPVPELPSLSDGPSPACVKVYHSGSRVESLLAENYDNAVEIADELARKISKENSS